MQNRYVRGLLTFDGRGIGTIKHDAAGADLVRLFADPMPLTSKFRYSTDYRRTWSEWAVYASTPTALPWSAFNGSALTQRHIDVQVRLDGHRAAEPSLYWSSIAASASHQASADMVKLQDGHTRIFDNLYAVGGPGHRHSAETISAAHSTPSATTWASCRPCRGSGTEPGP